MTDEKRPESCSSGAENSDGETVETPKRRNRNTSGLRPPWPKGVSGNPNGRPKGKREFSESCQEHADAARDVLVRIMHNSKASPRARISAASTLIERGYGKPDMTIQGPGGGPVYVIGPTEAKQIGEGLDEKV